jgi:hypothetical protein
MKDRKFMMAALPPASTCGGGSCSAEQPSVLMLVRSVNFAYLDTM